MHHDVCPIRTCVRTCARGIMHHDVCRLYFPWATRGESKGYASQKKAACTNQLACKGLKEGPFLPALYTASQGNSQEQSGLGSRGFSDMFHAFDKLLLLSVAVCWWL
eukprot:1161652-Pelagomonas_calceolata.AAC.8